MRCDEFVSLLSAYLDDELDLTRSVDMEKHMETCETCQKAVESQRALQSALRSSSLYYTSPARVEQRVLRVIRTEERERSAPAVLRWRRYSYATTFAVVLLLVWGIWHFTTLPNRSDVIADEALASHLRSLMANHLTDVVSSDRHTVKPWFNGKVDYSPAVEDMADQGFPLTGGRMDYVDGRPVAALIYMRQKHVINLFSWPDAVSGSVTTLQSRRGYNLIHWTRPGTTYWVVSDLNATELRDFAARYQERIALHSRP